MKCRLLAVVFVMMFVSIGVSSAAEDQKTPGAQAAPQSLGGQTGEAARELKDTADESYKTGAAKIGEASRKMEADAREALKTLQKQWDTLAKQLQEKTQQISKQLQKQAEDFNKSLNQPKK